MKVQVDDSEEKSTKKLTVELPAEDLERAMQEVYKKRKNEFSIPGFRKGKVPRNLIEKMAGPEIFYEDAAEILVRRAYPDAVRESGEDIVSHPTLDVSQVEKGKPFIFTAVVAVRPEVTLGKYMGVPVTEIDTEVADEEITAEINKERESNARLVSVEGRAAKHGETVVIDYEGFCDGAAFEGGKGENHSLEIGSASFIPGFEEQLIGRNIGEEFDVDVTFPEDYHSPELAGKEAVFRVKIHEIKMKERPELDDEFVQDVSEFDTVEEYQENVREKLSEQKEGDAKSKQRQEALRKVAEASEIDIPSAMVDMQCEGMINSLAQQLSQQGMTFDQYLEHSDTTLEQLGKDIRPEAERRIREDLVLEAVAEAEGLEVADEEIDAEIEKMAEMYRMDAGQLKSQLTEEDREDMRLDLIARKALEAIEEGMEPVLKPEPDEAEFDDDDEEVWS